MSTFLSNLDQNLSNVTANGVVTSTLTACDVRGCSIETENVVTSRGLVWFANDVPNESVILLPILEVSKATIEGQVVKTYSNQFTFDECLLFGPGTATWSSFQGVVLGFFRLAAVPLDHSLEWSRVNFPQTRRYRFRAYIFTGSTGEYQFFVDDVAVTDPMPVEFTGTPLDTVHVVEWDTNVSIPAGSHAVEIRSVVNPPVVVSPVQIGFGTPHIFCFPL